MTIQILGLRPYTKKGTTKVRQAEKFFEKGWRPKSVAELFQNIETYIAAIPVKEHYNMFYTVSDCFEAKGRKIETQSIIPYDIDGIDLERIEEYIPVVLKSIGDLTFSEVGIVFSGNGLQFLVETDQIIDHEEYFDDTRPYYKAICDRLNASMKQAGLRGSADDSVWSPARLMRLPQTGNIKTPATGYAKKNSTKQATMHQRMIVCQKGYDVKVIADLPDVPKEEQINVDQLARFPDPDSKAVLSECDFIQECIDKPNEVSEENWYKMLSVVARLNNGHTLAHTFSSGHDSYDEGETDTKIDQALLSSGPRTCKNIEKSFSKCKGCKHYQSSILSPILIKGPDYIGTKNSGFRKIKMTAGGEPVSGKPNYDDLMKHFFNTHPFMCLPSRILFVHTGKYWKQESDSYIEAFAEDHLNPKPNSQECSEFKAKIYRNNIKHKEFFSDSTENKINLDSGVLDLSGTSPIHLAHSVDFGFMSVLPYAYDPEAKSPKFDQFIKDITCNREQLGKVLGEFAGYSFAGDKCRYAKALVLLGGGSNGKSTFMNVLSKLAGKDAYSSVSLGRFDNDQYTAQLQGKLFNMTEETPSKAFSDSSVFKNIVTGGDITVKVVYKEPYLVECRAKIIFACNELPWLNDTTRGMMRRLLIVPFEADFKGPAKDKWMDEKLATELAGILNWVLEGYYRLKKQNGFTKANQVADEVDQYLESSDIIYRFNKDHLEYYDKEEKGFDVFTTSQDIYDAYRMMCNRDGVRWPKEKQQFLIKLTTYMPDVKDRRTRKGKLKLTGYKGLTIRDLDDAGGF